MQPLSTGESPQITVRMPKELIDWMDRERAVSGASRSSFIRRALSTHLHDLKEEGDLR